MKKKNKVLLTSLAVFSFGICSVSALEAEKGWNKVESSSTSIEVDKITAFEEMLATKVEELNLSSIKSNLNKLYRYRIINNSDKEQENYKKVDNNQTFETENEATNWALTNEPEEEGWSFVKNIIQTFKLDKILNLVRYETKEEAESVKQEFENSIDKNSGNVNITEIRDEEGDVTTNVENNQKFSTFEGAEAAAEGLRENNHDYIVTAEVVKEAPKFVETETLEISVTFSTKKEAEDYIANLTKEGYTVTSQIEEVNETNNLSQKYEELSNAEQALRDFLTAYPQTTVSNIEEIRDETEDTKTTTKKPEEYNTELAAKEAAKKLEENNHDYQITTTIRKETKTTEEITKTIESEQFDTELEALNYIENLKSQGYDTTNLKVELVPFEESVWEDQDGVVVNPGASDGKTFTYNHFDVTLLTSFTKIDASGNKTTVNGSVAINSVKINNKRISMNSLSKDPNTGLYEYTSKERNRLNVTNKSLVAITGTVTFNNTTLPFSISGYLSESQNVCGGRGNSRGYDLEFESITIINNKVVIDTNIVNKYKVTGTATKTTTQDVWYIDTTKITKGYDYQVTANGVKLVGFKATGTATKDIYQDVYSLVVKETVKDYDYEVEGNGEKTYYNIISEYIRLADIEWIIESMDFGKGGNVEVLPPQTGVEEKLPLNIFSLLIALGLIIKKFI